MKYRGRKLNMSGVCIRRMVVTVFIFIGLFQTCIVKQSWAVEAKQYVEAQTLVEKMVSKYPQLVRLTIHAVPTGEKNSRIIACNIKEKIGKPSDPEDLEAMKTNKTVVLKEGNNLDVTAPICNKEGKPIAATGITLRFKKGEKEGVVVERAKAIARELTDAIQGSKKTLW